MKAVLLSSIALILLPASVAAQSIDVSELGSASAYEPGTLSYGDGGLSQNLWNGTGAETAQTLITALPDRYSNPVARNLVRAALLSPGVPPQGGINSNFQQSRLDAIIGLSEMAAAQDIVQRTPELSGSRELKADMALLAGDIGSACSLSDSVLDARSESYWMKLRAFCHAERGETAAAELTLDLLRSSGDNDKGFQALMRQLMAIPGKPDLKDVNYSPLSMAMMDKAALDWPGGELPPIAAARKALNPVSGDSEKLAALFMAGSALSDAQLTSIIDGFGSNMAVSGDLAGGFGGIPGTPNLDAALADNSPRGFGQLLTLSQLGQGNERSRAVAAMLKRASSAGAFDRFVRFLEPQLRTLSYSQIGQPDIAVLTRAAVAMGDISALQQIHSLLDGRPEAQDRVALAADALGNGFYAGTLGTDIDSRLAKSGQVKSRALRDALIAHALGAQLSETALDVLEAKATLGPFSGSLFALDSSSKLRAEAETALRAALMIEKKSRLSDLEIYKIIDGLYKAGLTDFAAKLAAQDFLSDFLG